MPANLTQILNFKANFHQEFELFKKKTTFMLTMVDTLTLYDPGGGGFKSPPPLRFFALTHLILELNYCALENFPKK